VLVQSKPNKHVGAVSFPGPRASFGQSPVANGDGSCLIAEISLRPCQSGAWRDALIERPRRAVLDARGFSGVMLDNDGPYRRANHADPRGNRRRSWQGAARRTPLSRSTTLTRQQRRLRVLPSARQGRRSRIMCDEVAACYVVLKSLDRPIVQQRPRRPPIDHPGYEISSIFGS
jgi:hypothetical protein